MRAGRKLGASDPALTTTDRKESIVAKDNVTMEDSRGPMMMAERHIESPTGLLNRLTDSFQATVETDAKGRSDMGGGGLAGARGVHRTLHGRRRCHAPRRV
jgi:hypothetical protein